VRGAALISMLTGSFGELPGHEYRHISSARARPCGLNTAVSTEDQALKERACPLGYHPLQLNSPA